MALMPSYTIKKPSRTQNLSFKNNKDQVAFKRWIPKGQLGAVSLLVDSAGNYVHQDVFNSYHCTYFPNVCGQFQVT